jgi:hypothetical protein
MSANNWTEIINVYSIIVCTPRVGPKKLEDSGELENAHLESLIK